MKTRLEAKIERAMVWIETLRLKTYKQGQQQLGDEEEGFCCLGVACKLGGVEFDGHFGYPDEGVLEKSIGLLSQEGNYTHASPSARSKAAMKKIRGAAKNGRQSYNLPDLNDASEFDFKQIATMIVADPYAYFDELVADAIELAYEGKLT